MVSLGIFSVAMLLVVGGFIRSLRTERQSSAFTYVNNNMSIVIEQMAREIRTGFNFCINGNSCPSSSVLSFVNSSGNTITYCLENGAVNRIIGSNCIPGQEITSSKVSIDYLTFIISGNQDDDGYPPRVTVLIGAKPKDQSSSMYNVNFQTTVSSRIIGA